MDSGKESDKNDPGSKENSKETKESSKETNEKSIFRANSDMYYSQYLNSSSENFPKYNPVKELVSLIDYYDNNYYFDQDSIYKHDLNFEADDNNIYSDQKHQNVNNCLYPFDTVFDNSTDDNNKDLFNRNIKCKVNIEEKFLDVLLVGMTEVEFNEIFEQTLEKMKENKEKYYNTYDMKYSYDWEWKLNSEMHEIPGNSFNLNYRRRQIWNNLEIRAYISRQIMSKYILMDRETIRDPFPGDNIDILGYYRKNRHLTSNYHFTSMNNVLKFRLNLQQVYLRNVDYYYARNVLNHKYVYQNSKNGHIVLYPMFYLYLGKNFIIENSYYYLYMINTLYKKDFYYKYNKDDILTEKEKRYDMDNGFKDISTSIGNDYQRKKDDNDYRLNKYSYKHLHYPNLFNNNLLFNHYMPYIRKYFNNTSNKLPVNIDALYYPFSFRPYWKNGIVLEYNAIQLYNKWTPETQITFRESSFYKIFDYEFKQPDDNFFWYRKQKYSFNRYPGLYDTGMFPEFRYNRYSFDYNYLCASSRYMFDINLNSFEDKYGEVFAEFKYVANEFKENINKYAPTFVGDVDAPEWEEEDYWEYSQDTPPPLKVKPKYDNIYYGRQLMYNKNLTNTLKNIDFLDPRINDWNYYLSEDEYDKYKYDEYFSKELSQKVIDKTNFDKLQYISKYYDKFTKIVDAHYGYRLRNSPYQIDFINIYSCNNPYYMTLTSTLPYHTDNSVFYQKYYDDNFGEIFYNRKRFNHHTAYDRKRHYLTRSLFYINYYYIPKREYDGKDQYGFNSWKDLKIYGNKHKLLENNYNTWNDPYRFQMDHEQFQGLKFVAYEVKQDKDYVYHNPDGSHISAEKPDKYIVDLKLYCIFKKAINVIFNDTCKFDSLGEIIFSISMKIYDSPALLNYYNKIKSNLNKHQAKVFDRINTNLGSITQQKHNPSGNIFDYGYNCKQISDFDHETLMNTNVYYNYFHTDIADWDTKEMENVLFNSIEDKKDDTDSTQDTRSMFKNASCIRDKLDLFYTSTIVQGIEKVVPISQQKMKLLYLSYVFAYEWFVVCGEGIFTLKEKKDCDSSIYCRQCNMNTVYNLWTTLFRLYCPQNVFRVNYIAHEYPPDRFYDNKDYGDIINDYDEYITNEKDVLKKKKFERFP